jgi:hypothetical protein
MERSLSFMITTSPALTQPEIASSATRRSSLGGRRVSATASCVGAARGAAAGREIFQAMELLMVRESFVLLESWQWMMVLGSPSS